MKKLAKTELAARMPRLDEEMKRQGVPLRFRPLESFKKLYGPVPDGSVRRELFGAVMEWFIDRYGDRAIWDRVLGRIPVLIRQELYLAQVPFVIEDTVTKLSDRIEGLPKDVVESFTREEFCELGPKVSAATEAIQKLYTLHVDDHILEESDRELIKRALFDFEHTAASLKHSGDTQNAVFHSHAAAEKFLKVALKKAVGQNQLKSLRHHDLRKIFRALVDVQERFNWLESSITVLQDFVPNMNIRYSDAALSMENAVTAYNAALSICGTLAGVWLLDATRGSSESAFKRGRFYVDGGQRTYLCTDVRSSGEACLRLFIAVPLGGLVMADIRVDPLYSSLYLEVTRKDQIEALQQKYDFHLRNRGRAVTAEEIGLKMTSGPEGSYVTAVPKIQIRSK